MAKKLVGIMIFLCVVLAGGIVYIRGQADHTGPEITDGGSEITVYTPDVTDADLLKGMSAIDEKDGDVSDTLTVESVYSVDDSSVVVTYAAKDDDNNITKYKRTMEAEMPAEDPDSDDSDEDETDEDETDGEASDGTEAEEADADGEENGETDEAATPTPEPEQEQDEAEVLKQEQEAEAESMPEQNPRIHLTEYLVKLPVGSAWNPLDYVSEITDDQDDTYALWRKIQVADEVSTAAAGTYECTYYVVDSQNNVSNNAVIKVIVE